MAEKNDRELVNPYQHGGRRRLSERLGRAGVLRRRLAQVIVLLVSVTLVAGTVATSCGPQYQPPVSGTSSE